MAVVKAHRSGLWRVCDSRNALTLQAVVVYSGVSPEEWCEECPQVWELETDAHLSPEPASAPPPPPLWSNTHNIMILTKKRKNFLKKTKLNLRVDTEMTSASIHFPHLTCEAQVVPLGWWSAPKQSSLGEAPASSSSYLHLPRSRLVHSLLSYASSSHLISSH